MGYNIKAGIDRLGKVKRIEMNNRRSNIQIIADILRVGEHGAGKTEIMYRANMSYNQIQKYLGFLIRHGFVNKVKVGNPTVLYQVTDSGLKLLKNIDSLMEILGWLDQ